jgi:hypothetical protein
VKSGKELCIENKEEDDDGTRINPLAKAAKNTSANGSEEALPILEKKRASDGHM